jgi:hypothetical protein
MSALISPSIANRASRRWRGYPRDLLGDQLPDRPRIRNTQNYAPDMLVLSRTRKKRTKIGSQQLWRERAVERAKRPSRQRSQSTGPAQKARRYWASKGAGEAGETCCPGSSGGGLETRIQRSPFSAQLVRTLLAALFKKAILGPITLVIYLSGLSAVNRANHGATPQKAGRSTEHLSP